MSAADMVLLLTGGLAAGALGGFLGLGGGIIIMPLLRFAVGLPPATAAGTCVAAVLFTTMAGSYRHHRLGHLHLGSAAPIILAGAVASSVASLLFPALARRGHWLDLGVGIVFVAISVRMIVESAGRGARARDGKPAPNTVQGTLGRKIGLGAAAGALPGLLGIGTGGFLVPAITYLLETPIRTAMAASLSCFFVTALVSSAFKLGQGFVDLHAAPPLCLGALLGAHLGAGLNSRSAPRTLKLVFGLVFAVISLRFIYSFIMVGP